nr:MAG TPA: hypothetical protein [Bacteriophage sp.]
MAEIQKKVLHTPPLPTAIQGDGRYLLSVLRSFMQEQTTQINAANSFTADEVEADKEGKILSPRNFRLTFSRLGGLMQWDHSLDAKNLNYYEVRTNKSVGSEYGLLERTTRAESNRMPTSYVGHIFLFAIDKQGQVSHPSELSYTKARPTKPCDVAMTKTQEGTLITFLEIPLDCIGAYIYVNDVRYESVDNIFLYTGGAIIERLRVAYYDQYGEGESEVLYCVMPDVENFIVERNGSQLDFMWDPLPIYNVRYEVKVGIIPEWDKALTIFTTKLNKHRFVYPNTGRYYMLIKAIDEHDNYSKNAAYFLLTNEKDIHKNVIIRLDQEKTGYNGNKINLYYDKAREALLLEKDALRGEYLIDVKLPQKYRARNWLEASVIGETNSSLVFDDLDFAWNSEEAANTMWNGTVGDLRGVEVLHEIARYDPLDTARFLVVISLDGTLTGTGATVRTQKNVVYAPSRWTQGLRLSWKSDVSYDLRIPQQFSLMFWIRLRDGLSDTRILALTGDGSLALEYDRRLNDFCIVGSDGVYVRATIAFRPNDCLAVGIVQEASVRRLFLYSLAGDVCTEGSAAAKPLKNLTRLVFAGTFE